MIVLDVVGLPAPQGSKTAFQRGGKVVMVDGGSSKTGRAKLASWRQSVRNAAQAWLALHPQAPLDEPLSMALHFRFPLPATDPHRSWHRVAPDLDKLVRAVFDSLVHAGLLKDDSVVCELEATKMYAALGEAVGCTVAVSSLAEAEREAREHSKAAAKEARKAAAKPDDGQVSLLS